MTIEEPVFVCINSCEEMKRNEEAIAGQLWVQGDRQMTASNKFLDGMVSSRDSALLSAAVEAVKWKHPLELERPRKVQRVIIYPKNSPQLDAFLSSGGDPNVSTRDGHPIAFNSLLQESCAFETPPTFLREDSEEAATDPRLAGRTSVWMALSRQVAVGNRRRVLEDGIDVMDSDEQDDPDLKPDKLTGMYTAEMDPKQGPHKLSQSEAAWQRAAAQARKEQMILSVPRVESPQSDDIPEVVPEVGFTRSGGSSDDDDLSRPEWVWSEIFIRWLNC
jgi:hypothetical protein